MKQIHFQKCSGVEATDKSKSANKNNSLEPLDIAGSARDFGYTVYRGFLNRVYGIFQLKYGYSVYHVF